MLPTVTYVLNDATKNKCNHHDVINKMEIYLQTRHHAIRRSRLIVDHTIEGAYLCDVTSKVAEALIAELAVVEQIMQKFVAL